MAAITVGFTTRLGTVILPPVSAGDGATPSSAPPPPVQDGSPVPAASAVDSAAAKASAVQSALQNAIVYFLTSQSL